MGFEPRVLLLLLSVLPVMGQETGERVTKDSLLVSKKEHSSISELRAKASGGDAESQYNLAGHYGLGQLLPQDFTEVARWARKAAIQGHAGGQYLLGVCYGLGKGVPLNQPEAVKWFKKSANQGNVLAQYNLGVCYTEGKGVRQDYLEALRWSRMAADKGNPEAQFLVAACYGLGHGVPENFEEAYVWASLAAAQGHNNGIKFHELIQTKLAPKAIKRAQARAEKLKAEILLRKNRL